MSDLDVLIIGGYSLSEVWSSGGTETRDQIRLNYGNHLVTLNFIKHFTRNNGNLDITENLFQKDNSSRLVSRSLNTIYLYDYLTKNNVTADAINYFLYEQEKLKKLIKKNPKVVAISTTFITEVDDINHIAKSVRELSPGTKIVVGGIKVLKSYRKFELYNKGYFNGFTTEPLVNNNFFFKKENDSFADFFVIEEHGEATFLELVNRIINDQDYKDIPNIAYRNNGELIFTKRAREPFTFEHNIVSWDMVPKDILGQEIPVMAGIGCPFKCGFCDFTGLHKVQIRSLDSLISELQRIQAAHPGMPVFFTDDNLFTTKKRTKDLATAIIKHGLKFRWRAFFRTDAINEENAELLAKAGCSSAFLGVESGDAQILKNMNKKTTKEQSLIAVNCLAKNGINSISFILIGFPGETKGTINNTIDMLNSYPDVKWPIIQYYPLVFLLLPLAPVVSPENRKKFGIHGGYDQWSHLTMNSDQAKVELLRIFKEVNVPILPYLEYIDPDIPISKFKAVLKARENIVKTGINVLNKENSSQIFNAFKNILG